MLRRTRGNRLKAWVGGTFTPADLGASLLAWWNADRSDLITLSGSQITSWKDVVAAYDEVQAVAGSRPLYSATSFNGDPGATYDGTDDVLSLESVPIPNGANPLEFWFTCNQTALAADTTARQVAGWGLGSSTNGQVRVQRAVVTGVNRARLIVGTGAGSVTVTDTAVDFSGYHYGRVVIDGANIRLDIDGNTGTPSACVPGIGTTRTRLGANASNTASGFWQGDARDYLFTSILTSGQASNMSAWCAGRLT